MATAFAQLPLKSLRNREGPMKYPKIIIPNLAKKVTGCFKYFGLGLNIQDSCIELIDFTFSKKLHIIRFNFLVLVSITHDQFWLFVLSRNHILFVSIFHFWSQPLMINFDFLYYQEIAYHSFQFFCLGLNYS